MRVPNPRMSDPERVYPRLSGGVNVQKSRNWLISTVTLYGIEKVIIEDQIINQNKSHCTQLRNDRGNYRGRGVFKIQCAIFCNFLCVLKKYKSNPQKQRDPIYFFAFFVNSWNELSNVGGHLSEPLIGNQQQDQTLTLRSMGNELVLFSLQRSDRINF